MGEKPTGGLSMVWSALAQTWQPFVLVIGLLLIGHVASGDGLFEFAGARLARIPGGAVALFVAMMLLCALVTATLNLDTSVVFLTPVLLHTARRRAADETAFLYGSIFMANAASLLLLGSNLTNVLVFSNSDVTGDTFTRHMLLAWIVAVVLTTCVVLVWRRRALTTPSSPEHEPSLRLTPGAGLVGVALATLAMLVLRRPALAVLVVALVVVALDALLRHRVHVAPLVRGANLPAVLGLFVLASAVSVASRYWHLAEHLVGTTDSWQTAAVAALSSNVLNNLPAAALLSASFPAHPYSLLLGLNLGPNLTVVGALSSVLWWRVARREGASPSAWTFTRIGVVVTLVTMVGCLLVV